MRDYINDSGLYAEQMNTLVMLDQSLRECIERPTFEICGGTGLVLHGVNGIFTVDIDVVQKMSPAVSALVEPFISDAAAEVAVLPKNYEGRMVPIPDFDNMDVFVLSIKDIIVLKLQAWRVTDKEDIQKTDVLQRIEMADLRKILSTEFNEEYGNKLNRRFDEILEGL